MQPVAPVLQSTSLGKSYKMGDFTSQQSGHGSGDKRSSRLLNVWCTPTHIILNDRRRLLSLWCSKEDGKILPGRAFDEEVISTSRKLESYGVIGKIKFIPDSDWKLLLITQARKIGRLPPTMAKVYCIEQVSLVSLSTDNEPQRTELYYEKKERDKEKDKEREKLEKKLTEELLNMFNGSQSYYFSYDADLTQSLQRQEDCGDAEKLRHWERVDERFFWNYHMIAELIDGSFGTEIDPWVVPIIQGYIEIKEVPIPSPSNLGVFKSYKHLTNSLSTIDISTFTIIDKDGDEILPECVDGGESGNITSLGSSGPSNGDNGRKDMHTPTSCYDNGVSLQPDSSHNPTPQPSPPRPTGNIEPHLLDVSTGPNDSPPPAIAADTPVVAMDTSLGPLSTTSVDSDEVTNERYEGFSESIEEEGGDRQGATLRRWTLSKSDELSLSSEGLPLITMALISRRSRHRAGTRYLKRGVDREGHVANFVETEMILKIDTHVLSFMIVRGSVPVYWTQPGHKYRPTPILQQDDNETQKAFISHFEQQINLYNEAVIINLVNRTGKERTIGRAYEQQLLQFNYPGLTYIGFDFHEHCKLNQWHNIYMLLDKVEPYLNHQKYFWVDLSCSNGPHCIQNGVFRVNCMDCLDRTNVVQSVICKEFLQMALARLGLLGPFEALSGQFLFHYQSMWANNGDIISKQYTGTIAMKGDLTRYGHRKLYGVMKDGYNSANRYLKSVFKDAYRQMVIDLQQGMTPQEALHSLPRLQRNAEDVELSLHTPLAEYSSWPLEREQAVQEMIDICRKELYPNVHVPVQGWALLEAAGYSFIPSSTKEEETVLLLCEERRHICIANPKFEQVACCLRIPLERIDRIVIGPIGTLLRSSRQIYMRLHYTLFPGHSCYFTFKTIRQSSLEEDKLLLLSIAHGIAVIQPTIGIQEQRLAKKQSQAHEGIVFLIAPSEWLSNEWGLITPQNQPHPSSPSKDNSRSPSPNMYEALYESLPAMARVPTHSRQSSTTSGIALITFSDTESKHTVSTSSSNRTSPDGDRSFSAPNSPNLQRRTSFISFEERSRILSHSSYDDLTSLVMDSDDTKVTDDTGIQSDPFSLNESDSEGEEEIVMGQVLSTPRYPSKASAKYMPSPMSIAEGNMAQPNISVSEPITSTSPSTTPKETEIVSSGPSISAGGKYLSKLKGRLFPKVQQSSADPPAAEGSRSRSNSNEKTSTMNNVTQVISILRNISGQDLSSIEREQDRKDTPTMTDDEILMQQCLAANKTRFIFI